MSADFRGSLFEEETSARATYSWSSPHSRYAFGGSYTTEHLSGASAVFRFTGTGVIWYTHKGLDQGLAGVAIDGVWKGTFTLYSATSQWLAPMRFTGLSARTHSMQISVRGLKGSKSGTDTFVSIDAFGVGRQLYTTPTVTYHWQHVNVGIASGQFYDRSDVPGASTTFTFRGTDLVVFGITGPNGGWGDVYIDGVYVDTLDYYDSVYSSSYAEYTGTDGIHTVRLVVVGKKDAAATGKFVSIDLWGVD